MATILFAPSPPNQSSSMAAVNLCPDSPINLCSSPRISFSYILDHHPSSDHIARSDQNLCSNDSEFDFCLCLPEFELTHQISTADELFLDGVILPTQVKQANLVESSSSIAPKKDEEDGTIVTSTKASLIREEKGNSKSFWRFMRSSSLNCDGSSQCKKTSFWSSLARSNSTGSGSFTKSTTKHAHGKLVKSAPKSSGKPPLRKAQSLTCANNANPYIIKGTSHLLGFGSLFRSGKKPCV